MIYSVHLDYSKYGSRKSSRKFEGMVLAKNEGHAEEVVRKMVDKYPIKIELLTVIDSGDYRSIGEIYKETPSLEIKNITLEKGYIFREDEFRRRLETYFS